MATPAPTLSRSQQMKSISSKKKKPAVKTILCSPYNPVWPLVEAPVEKLIIEQLKTHAALLTKNPSVQLGLQKVTRSLERDVLRLVVVDRSAPWQLHRHLVQLCGVRACAAMAVCGLAAAMCAPLGVSRLCAVGFAKKVESEAVEESQPLQDLVDTIIKHAPTITLPWLECERSLLDIKKQTVADPVEPNQSAEPGQSESSDSSRDDLEESSDPIGRAVNQSQKDNIAPSKSEEAKSETVVESTTVIDYSHLYIFKADKARDKRPSMEGLDFVALPSSDEDCEDLEDRNVYSSLRSTNVPGVDNHSRQLKGDKKGGDSSTKPKRGDKLKGKIYIRPNIGKMIGNPAKKQKKSK